MKLILALTAVLCLSACTSKGNTAAVTPQAAQTTMNGCRVSTVSINHTCRAKR